MQKPLFGLFFSCFSLDKIYLAEYNNVYNKITKRGIYSWQKRLVQ